MAGRGGFDAGREFANSLIAVVRAHAALDPRPPSPSLYPHIDFADFRLAAVVAVSLFLLRELLGRVVMPRLLAKSRAPDIHKITENVFYTAYYACTSVLCIFVVRREQWMWEFLETGANKRYFNVIFKDVPPPRSEIVHVYYMITLGFYIAAVVFLFAYDTFRSDFVEYVIHHFVTLGLVLMSFFHGYLRCGVAIMALHDVGDLLLYLAKTLHYLGLAGIDTVVFSAFALVFYVTRLVLLPRISYAVTVETIRELVSNPTFNNWAPNIRSSLLQWAVFSGLINVLILMHCFWFALILKMIYREVFLGKKISQEGDIREG
jgi:ceramide synthetase